MWLTQINPKSIYWSNFVFITSWIKTLSLTFIHTSMEYKPNFLKVFFSSKEIIFKTAKKSNFFDFHMLGFSVNLRENSQIFSFFWEYYSIFFSLFEKFLILETFKKPFVVQFSKCHDLGKLLRFINPSGI